jgi:hypothetical protein
MESKIVSKLATITATNNFFISVFKLVVKLISVRAPPLLRKPRLWLFDSLLNEF